MARWRLLNAHYLYTNPPTEWEQKETSRDTGRQTVVRYKVPRLLEPKDPSDWNYPATEEIIVCNGNNPQRFDIIFLGEPTPDMEPIDDEAKKISKSFEDSGKWTKAPEGMDYGENLIKTFLSRMEAIQANQTAPTPAPVSAGIDPKAFAVLQEQVSALMNQNAQLQAQVAEKSARRV